jgi:hypothetical protein
MNCEPGISGLIIRDLTKDECYWLKFPIDKLSIVYKYLGSTYGCIADSGIAVCIKKDTLPFIEVPRDAVLWSR